MGHNPMTLRLRPELKLGVWHLTDYATQESQNCTSLNSLMVVLTFTILLKMKYYLIYYFGRLFRTNLLHLAFIIIIALISWLR